MTETTCFNCKKVYQYRKSKASYLATKKHFCSNECRLLNKRAIFTEISCLFCNKTFIRNKRLIVDRAYCSQKCSCSVINSTINRKKGRTCTACGASFVKKTINSSVSHCEGCVELSSKEKHDKIRNMTIREYYSTLAWKARHPQHKWNHIRKMCRTWNQNLIKNGCQVCGYVNHVEMAHIIPVSSYAETGTLGEVNSPENIYILCPNHHWELDNNLITPEQIKPRL